MQNPGKQHLIVFAKPPVSGKVKTRLARQVGDTKATDIYRQLLDHTFLLLESLQDVIQSTIAWADAFDDFTSNAKFQHWLQPIGTLGEKMAWAVRKSLRNGSGKVVIIGVDCPTLIVDDIISAFQALDHSQVVLGPAEDGGYYLVGSTQDFPALFPDIKWGTNQVLQKTIESLRNTGISYYLLEKKYDIDTISEWERWRTSTQNQ